MFWETDDVDNIPSERNDGTNDTKRCKRKIFHCKEDRDCCSHNCKAVVNLSGIQILDYKGFCKGVWVMYELLSCKRINVVKKLLVYPLSYTATIRKIVSKPYY